MARATSRSAGESRKGRKFLVPMKAFQNRNARRYTVIGLVFTLLACLLLSAGSYFLVMRPYIASHGYAITEEGKDKLLSTPLLENSTVQQNFSSVSAFHGMAFRLNFSKYLPEDAKFQVKLFNGQEQEAFSKEFLFSEETSDAFLNILFEESLPSGDYRLEFASTGINNGLEPGEEENQFYIWLAKDVASAKELATVNFFPQHGDLDLVLLDSCEFFVWPFVIGCIILTVVACCCVILRFLPLEWFYCLLGGAIGLTLLFVQSPMYGFDTRFHADTSYLISNQLLGTGRITYRFEAIPEGMALGAAEQSLLTELEKDTAELEAMRESLTEKEYTSQQEGLGERYEELQEGTYYLRRACDDFSESHFPRVGSAHAKVIRSFASSIKEGYFLDHSQAGDANSTELVAQKIYDGIDGMTSYLYVPQALGFTVARLLGMNAHGLLLMGRLFNFFVYLFLTAAAIRCAPFAKNLMFLVALLPTSIQLGASLSRDSLVLALSFFCIAKILQFSYSKERIAWFHTIPVLAAALLLAPAKAVYFLVSLLCVFAMIRRYAFPEGLRQKKISPKHLAFFLMGLVLVIVAFTVVAWPNIASRLSATETASVNTTLGLEDPGSYTFLYCLGHPVEVLALVFRTFYNGLGEILFNAVVPFELEFGYSWGVLFAWILCLLLCVCHAPQQEIPLTKGDRRIFLTVFLLTFLLLTGASILWTPLGNAQIWGLQGRYLTPVLPLLFLFFANRKQVALRKNPTRTLSMAALALSYLTLMDNYLWLFEVAK